MSFTRFLKPDRTGRFDQLNWEPVQCPVQKRIKTAVDLNWKRTGKIGKKSEKLAELTVVTVHAALQKMIAFY